MIPITYAQGVDYRYYSSNVFTMKIFQSWTFIWWEVGMLKVCLISFGIALAIHFYDVLAPLLTLWWVLFAVFAGYFLVQYFRDNMGGEV